MFEGSNQRDERLITIFAILEYNKANISDIFFVFCDIFSDLESHKPMRSGALVQLFPPVGFMS